MLDILVSIIRHGQTDCNARGVLQGQMETSLNAVGRQEAEKLGARLKNQYFSHLYSSNLERAFETARIVVKDNLATPNKEAFLLDARLRERGFGIFEGKPKSELADSHAAAAEGKDYPGRRHYVPPNGESMAQVYCRARECLVELCLSVLKDRSSSVDEGNADVSVLISTHGGVAIELFTFLVKELGCPPPDGTTKSQMIAIPGNTALSTFRLTLNPDLADEELSRVVSRPKDLITECVCLTIHDRSHCDDAQANGGRMTIY